MKIILRPHLKIRLEQRKIPLNYPIKITKDPEQKYFDTLTNHLIAIKNLEYNDKVRPMVTAYDIIGQDLQIITVHPSTTQEISNKVKRERWVKNDES